MLNLFANSWKLYSTTSANLSTASGLGKWVLSELTDEVHPEVLRKWEQVARRIISLERPLGFCCLWVQDKSCAVNDAVWLAKEALKEAEKFRVDTQRDAEKLKDRKHMVACLQYHISELDFAFQSLSLSMSVVTASCQRPAEPPCSSSWSPAALLRASHCLHRTQEQGGDLSVSFGRLYQQRVLYSEEAPGGCWQPWELTIPSCTLKIKRNVASGTFELHLLDQTPPATSGLDTVSFPDEEAHDLLPPAPSAISPSPHSSPPSHSHSPSPSHLSTKEHLKFQLNSSLFLRSVTVDEAHREMSLKVSTDACDESTMVLAWLELVASQIRRRYAFVLRSPPVRQYQLSVVKQESEPIDVLYLARLCIFNNQLQQTQGSNSSAMLHMVASDEELRLALANPSFPSDLLPPPLATPSSSPQRVSHRSSLHSEIDSILHLSDQPTSAAAAVATGASGSENLDYLTAAAAPSPILESTTLLERPLPGDDDGVDVDADADVVDGIDEDGLDDLGLGAF